MKMTNHRGTILIEAVISTVIIAISLTLIMQSLLGSYKGLNVQKDYAKALNTLENNLSQALSGFSDHDQLNSLEEGLTMEHSSMEAGQNLTKESFNANWNSGKQQHQVSLATFIYNAPDDQKQTGSS